MIKLKAIWILTALSILNSSCAKEQSEEERDREERSRKIQRLEQSEGVYNGILKSENGLIPLDLNVLAQKNTGNKDNDEPELIVTMNLGFFGGVKTLSSRASFDSNTGELVADFGSQTKNLELRGNISNNNFSGLLTGSEQGTFEVELNKKSLTLLENNKTYYYSINIGNEKKSSGELVIKPQSGKRQSTASNDLLSLPALEATFRFLGFGSTPLILKEFAILYDPIAGSMEIDISGSAKIIIEDIYYDFDMSKNNLTNMTAVIELGQKKHETLQLTLIKNKSGKDFTKVPKYFTGSYKGGQSSNTYNIIGQFEKSGNTITNPLGVPFTHFPDFFLNLSICLGDEVYKEFNYKAISVDHVKKTMKMKNAKNSSQIIEFSYSNSFSTMDGIIINVDESNTAAFGTKILLDKSEDRKSCENLSE